VTVGTVNRAPLTNAGADQMNVGTDAALNGTATDENSHGLLTSWSAVPDSADVSFANPNALNTTVHFARPGVYTLRLTATDGELSGSDEVTIVVAASQLAAIKGKAQNRR
jgi:PKD repeat protein